jgi:hypothetical protein
MDQDEGLMIGEGLHLAHGHRHWSNLFPVFPTYDLKWSNEDHRSLINKSVTWWEHFHPANGFTYAGAAIYDAMIPGRADAARDQLVQFVYGEQYPHGGGGANTLYTEGSQCNESPLMLAFALQQMLLQSYDGDVHLFPALPSSWPNATFYRMRTEGAYLVSASARHGYAYAVNISAAAEASAPTAIVRADFGPGCKAVQSDPAGAVTMLSCNRYKVALGDALGGARGAVLIWPAGERRPTESEFDPLPMAAANRSHFGVPGHGRPKPV